jgi:hypothetical protein
MGRENIRREIFPPFATTQMVMRRAKDVTIASSELIHRRAEELSDKWKQFCRRFDGVKNDEDPGHFSTTLGLLMKSWRDGFLCLIR